MQKTARRLLPLVCALGALLLAPPSSGGRGMYIGAAEDAGKSVDLVHASAQMSLARLAGLNAIRLTAIWKPGDTAPSERELTALQNAASAANLNGIRIVLSVYHAGSKTTPLTTEDRLAFAEFTGAIARQVPSITSIIVGNEPNLNRFWMPQFSGSKSASPAAYFDLLALTYDTVKAVNPAAEIIGGSVSPRGGDNPFAARHTHTPTTFILELGKAYRASGRTDPIMDAFAFHPYGENSRQPPEIRRPKTKNIGLNDYDKLVAVLGDAFDGTTQRGSELPIVYDEYGVESRPPTAKRRLYSGREPATTKPVDEAVQGDYYRRALQLAYCQPTVKGILLFHVTDEHDLDRWQSGLFYPDDTPKASLRTVRTTIAQLRKPKVGRCKGIGSPVLEGHTVSRAKTKSRGATRARAEKGPRKPLRPSR